MTVGVSYPNNASCTVPDITAEIDDARGFPLDGVSGSPLSLPGGDACSTNASERCTEEMPLYWSNWCGAGGVYQIVATAFGGRLRSSARIETAPPCAEQRAASQFGGIHF